MLSSMTATARAGLIAPVITGRSPRTITVRKVPHRTAQGHLMRLREKHPGFTCSWPSSSIFERREIVFWPARQRGVAWCWSPAVGRSCVVRVHVHVRGWSGDRGRSQWGARLLGARLLGARLLGARLLGARLLGLPRTNQSQARACRLPLRGLLLRCIFSTSITLLSGTAGLM